MGLRKYKEKRNFSSTPEPWGKEKASKGALKFVVQKHHASHLHYDFRLEMDGVLKSWAIPKGPSMNPEDKRLAMMVEDHPMDYRSFEGIIPPGNYGAGTVMIWDEGTYELPGEADREKSEKQLLEDLDEGRMHIVLHGSKLKGEFTLFRMKNSGENAWLLVKKKDKYSSKKDITKIGRSVVSGRNLEEIREQAEEQGNVWESNRKKHNENSTPVVNRNNIRHLPRSAFEGAVKAPFPNNIKPMLATLVDDPFDRDDWFFEVKWDGYRAIAEVDGKNVNIYSRNLISFNERYPEVVSSLADLGSKAVLDGEIVAVDNDGIASFQLLQQYMSTGRGTLLYYVFDILYLDGYDLKELPLRRRKEILKDMLPENDVVRYSEHVEGNGIALFDAAIKEGLEGIIAKNAESPYRIGTRSRDWLKVKAQMRQEAVIVGFTATRGGRKYFGALVLGVYEGKELVYIGHTGGGFNDKGLSEVAGKLRPLITDKSPFREMPKTNMPVTWVKPRLVCEVSFREWTEGGHMRMPIFEGLRMDKDPREVKRESPVHTHDVKAVKADASRHALKIVHNRHARTTPAEEEKSTVKRSSVKKGAAKRSSAKKAAGRTSSKGKKPAAPEIKLEDGEEQLITISGRELQLTNLGKLYWKKEKYSKLDLINYYRRIAPWIMPYLKDRPESLNRHPNGITGKNFFQKDVRGKVADWIQTVEIYSESNNRHIDYLLCQDEATLIYLANLGCIELNPWHSRIGSLEYPDYCLIDLDPHEIAFEKVIETARVVKEVLDEARIPGYCKTSGASGLHICIPLGAKYNFDQSRNFAELIVTLVYDRLPEFTSMLRSPGKRRKKVYLDYLQNRQTQTIAAPYCVRPEPGATVSAPLLWDEVKQGLSPSQFTMKNIFDRLKDVGDIWKPVHGKGIDMKACLDRIAGMSR